MIEYFTKIRKTTMIEYILDIWDATIGNLFLGIKLKNRMIDFLK